MKSMTGYGRGQASASALAITVEINSVNRKQLEPAINLPRDLAALEPRVREVISAQLSRGRINLTITTSRLSTESGEELIDLAAATRSHVALSDLVERFQLSGGVELRSLLTMPGVLRSETQALDLEIVWPLLAQALNIALEELIAMRTREGADLRTDLEARLTNVRLATEKIHRLHPGVIEKYRAALFDRIGKLCAELTTDDERIAKEVVLFADRCDISEELTRLESHLGQVSENLTKSEPIGRTLEFLIQEISRELNTLGAKANDAAISQMIVACKSEMEKIREQVQNIE